MTEQDINIKIAEYLGMKLCPENNALYLTENEYGKPTYYFIPNYCNDLNAVWEVEEKLKEEELLSTYITELFIIVHECYEQDFTAHATAKQRCEAIIKVIGRDKE